MKISKDKIALLKKHYLEEDIRGEVPSFHDWLKIVTPTYEWDKPHLKATQEALQDVLEGKCKRLMIFEPPRHGKSALTTIRFPVYCLENNPTWTLIIASYGKDLSSSFSRASRTIARRRLNLDPENQSAQEWGTIEGGIYRAASVGSGITGKGGNLILIDDPVKSAEEANSKVYRDRVWDWYLTDCYTRLEPNGAIVLIMTKWHEDDLAGRLLERHAHENWRVIDFPALAMENDPLGRDVGEALWPERYSASYLKAYQKANPREFEALYQQRPYTPEGNVIPIDHFNYYEEVEGEFEQIIQSWDTAFKTKEENDFNVCTTWGVRRDGFYLLDRWKGKLIFPKLKVQVQQLAYQYNPGVVLIEDKASGQSIIQELQLDSRLNIVPVKVDRDKGSRASAATDTIVSGRVFLPKKSIWLKDFLDNLRVFPNGLHDDDVDSFSMAINYLTKRYANVLQVYPDYNDLIHAQSVTNWDRLFIVSLRVGIYIDNFFTCSIVGINDYDSLYVLAEHSESSSLTDLMDHFVMPFLEDYFPGILPDFYIRSDHAHRNWPETMDQYEEYYSDLSNIDLSSMINNVQSLLVKLNKGTPLLNIVSNQCPQIQEGFRGGYSYKNPGSHSMMSANPKPVHNQYARFLQSLEAAVWDYRNYVYDRAHPETIRRIDNDEGRSEIGGY